MDWAALARVERQKAGIDLPPHPISEDLLSQVVHLFAVLAQPRRIRIAERLLLDGEMSVQALADELGCTQQNMSRHLSLLYECGVVLRRQAGRQVFYRLVDLGVIALVDAAAAQVVTRLQSAA
ncbi:MAG: ArsR/SmtB family transcription factor [Solirubrobacteraceae bacterium]